MSEPSLEPPDPSVHCPGCERCHEHGDGGCEEDCWDCGGDGTFCPSTPDKCGGCETCARCGGTGVDPGTIHALTGTAAQPKPQCIYDECPGYRDPSMHRVCRDCSRQEAEGMDERI